MKMIIKYKLESVLNVVIPSTIEFKMNVGTSNKITTNEQILI